MPPILFAEIFACTAYPPLIRSRRICQECDAAINEVAMREADDPGLGW